MLWGRLCQTHWLACKCPLSGVRRSKRPGNPSHPWHPLAGRVFGPDGLECWLSSLAAEHPQGLCEVLAAEYAKYARIPTKRAEFISMSSGNCDPCRATKKEHRDLENLASTGGLRDPAASLVQLPGWRPVGACLAAVLSKVVSDHQAKFDSIFANIDTERAHGPSQELLQVAQ